MTPLGRAVECLRLDALLDEARDGRSGVLVVRGEAGVGKSTLLAYARDEALGFGFLTVRGMESESDLPFAGLGDLVAPILDRLPSIPPPQAAALAGSLAIGPPAGYVLSPAELARIKSGDVVLPTQTTLGEPLQEIRLRCVTEPDAPQKVLLNRLGLDLPRRLRQSCDSLQM